jgi:uncharacterized Zn-binding protein involved in type VI secretion
MGIHHMMRLLLCVGDEPQTGGYTVNSNTRPFGVCGHPAAIIGGHAYCNACKSMGPIAKAGGPRRINHTPHEIALDGDILLYKCPEPPRMVARMQSTFWHEDMAGGMGTVASAKTTGGGVSSVAMAPYDERVQIARTSAFESFPYFIETTDGRVFSGRVDSARLLPRVHTEGSDSYSIHWGDEALAKQKEV